MLPSKCCNKLEILRNEDSNEKILLKMMDRSRSFFPFLLLREGHQLRMEIRRFQRDVGTGNMRRVQGTNESNNKIEAENLTGSDQGWAGSRKGADGASYGEKLFHKARQLSFFEREQQREEVQGGEKRREDPWRNDAVKGSIDESGHLFFSESVSEPIFRSTHLGISSKLENYDLSKSNALHNDERNIALEVSTAKTDRKLSPAMRGTQLCRRCEVSVEAMRGNAVDARQSELDEVTLSFFIFATPFFFTAPFLICFAATLRFLELANQRGRPMRR